MKQRDLFRIKDDGQVYELTDGIYKYKLMAHTSSVDGEVFWSITCSNDRMNACFWKNSRTSTEDDFYNRRDYVKYTIISLTSLVTVGGMSFHGVDAFRSIRGLKFIPRGSYLKFLENSL